MDFNKMRLLTLPTVAALLLFGNSSAEQVVVQDGVDTEIKILKENEKDDNLADTVINENLVIEVRSDDHCWRDPHARGVFKFNLENKLPSDISITKAVFSVKVTFINGVIGEKIKIYEVTKEWDILKTSWNSFAEGSAWENPGGDYVATPIAVSTVKINSTQTWDDFDVTELVKRHYSDPSLNFGFIIVADGCDEATATTEFRYYYSSDAVGTFPDAEAPKLTVDYSGDGNPITVSPKLVVSGITISQTANGISLGNKTGANSFVSMFDLQGRQLIKEIVVSSGGVITLPTSNISSGVVMLKVNGITGSLTKKIILK